MYLVVTKTEPISYGLASSEGDAIERAVAEIQSNGIEAPVEAELFEIEDAESFEIETDGTVRLAGDSTFYGRRAIGTADPAAGSGTVGA